MHATRSQSLLLSIFLASGVLAIVVNPAAAATCTLTAPASVAIGSLLTIEGSGFPASTTVDVSITIEGGTPDEFSTQSDAAGAFQITLTPEAADRGQTTVVASAGAGCSAQVVVAVGIAAASSAPEPSDAGTGAEGGPPRTDLVSAAATGPGRTGMTLWLAVVLLASGIGGLILTRPSRAR